LGHSGFIEVTVKIDLHVHTRERSGCAKAGEESQIHAALHAGLQGVAITDHNRLVPAAHLAELNKKYTPFHIFTGIEVDADREHWLVLGVHNALLERPGWHYPELRDFVRWKGGFIALAHPFRYADEIRTDIDRCPPDGIEIQSFNTPARWEAEIRAIAERYSLILLRNTDAHFEGQVGSYYNELPEHIDNDQGLVRILRAMKTRPEPFVLGGVSNANR
jgi:predicted metal-dependent phosphoesterase TrpH